MLTETHSTLAFRRISNSSINKINAKRIAEKVSQRLFNVTRSVIDRRDCSSFNPRGRKCNPRAIPRYLGDDSRR